MSDRRRYPFQKWSCVALGLLLWAAPARAQFADDFEAGLLTTDVPPGRWDTRTSSVAGETLDLAPGAAHRGASGLQLLDSATTGPTGTHVRINSAQSAGNAVYLRTWFRLDSQSPTGSVAFVGLSGDNSGGGVDPMLQVKLFPGQASTLAGFDRTGVGLQVTPLAFQFVVGGWHLVEMAALGMGTANGTRALWVDGQAVGSRSGVDWSGTGMTGLHLGEPFGTSDWTGTVSFDDVRLSPTPPASHFGLVSPTPLVVSQCAAVTVTLLDSESSTAAPAPYDVDATLSVTGVPGAFYSDSDCLVASAALTVPSGDSSASAFFRPDAEGTATLLVLHPDFLPGSATAEVSAEVVPQPPDSGVVVRPGPSPTAAGPLRLTVGCGCDARAGAGGFPGVALALLGMALLHILRRASRG